MLAFERALLLDNAMLHFKYNDIQLPDLQLYTIEGDSLCLSDVLDDEYKLLIRFSYLHCSSCIHELFNGLSQIMEKFPSNRVLLIGTYQNQRTFDAFMTNYSLSYPIYWSNKKENILEKENMPYVCLIDKSRIIRNLMIPIKEMPNYSVRYYEIILDRFFADSLYLNYRTVE